MHVRVFRGYASIKAPPPSNSTSPVAVDVLAADGSIAPIPATPNGEERLVIVLSYADAAASSRCGAADTVGSTVGGAVADAVRLAVDEVGLADGDHRALAISVTVVEVKMWPVPAVPRALVR
ncbi:hypothetical protein [Actinomadura sp. NPDC000600]|uniref:hypothetical protein n=1 Tax=Actinomadura sp. NPDC000600 TaxID=3154262 RepID=UPI003392EC5D